MICLYSIIEQFRALYSALQEAVFGTAPRCIAQFADVGAHFLIDQLQFVGLLPKLDEFLFQFAQGLECLGKCFRHRCATAGHLFDLVPQFTHLIHFLYEFLPIFFPLFIQFPPHLHLFLPFDLLLFLPLHFQYLAVHFHQQLRQFRRYLVYDVQEVRTGLVVDAFEEYHRSEILAEILYLVLRQLPTYHQYYLWSTSTIFQRSLAFISSENLYIYSLMFMSPSTFLPASCIRCWYKVTISLQMSSILLLDFAVMSSMKSLMASLADSESILRMCLDLTKEHVLIVRIMFSSVSSAMYFLFLSSLRGCLNMQMRLWSIRQCRNFCSSDSNRWPRSVRISNIFFISLWQSFTERSRSALLIITTTPSRMSSNVLKDFSRFLVSLGSLSALASLMCDSSIISTIFTLGQISSSRCTKNELEISYSSPLLSLNPGQSQKARLSMTILLGIDVQEYFSWPILMSVRGQSKIGLSPSQRTVISAPDKKAIIVDLPTPVSPIKIMASLALGSFGMPATPLSIILRSFARFSNSPLIQNNYTS